MTGESTKTNLPNLVIALALLFILSPVAFSSSESKTTLTLPQAYALEPLMSPRFGKEHRDFIYDPCAEQIKGLRYPSRPVKPGPDPVPLVIGCALADCGPGAEGVGPIDVKITLSGDLAEAVHLAFENITKEEAARITVKGSASYIKGTTAFLVKRGTAILKGFRTDGGPRPPATSPILRLSKKAFAAFLREVDIDPLLADNRSPVALVIEQIQRRTIVNEYAGMYWFRHCLQLPKNLFEDSVKFNTATPPTEAVLLTPGRRTSGPSGCNSYEDSASVFNANGVLSVDVGYLFKDEDTTDPTVMPCHSEVVVYSNDRALAVAQPVTPPWSNSNADKVQVELVPQLTVPITVWILYDPDNEAEVDAKDEVDLATTAFSEQAMCGILFSEPTIHKVDLKTMSLPPERTEDDFLVLDPGDAVQRMKLDMNPPLYTAGSLNLYVIKDPVGDAGVTVHATGPSACQGLASDGPYCDPFGDMILLAYDRARDTTLAHEVGHTLSLEHTDGVLDDSNLMRGVSSGDKLTKGQCYRANVDYSSYVNTDGIRPAGSPTIRECPRNGSPSMVCPDLRFDWP